MYQNISQCVKLRKSVLEIRQKCLSSLKSKSMAQDTQQMSQLFLVLGSSSSLLCRRSLGVELKILPRRTSAPLKRDLPSVLFVVIQSSRCYFNSTPEERLQRRL